MIGEKIWNIVTSYNSLKMWIIGTVMNATKSESKSSRVQLDAK